MASKLKQKYNNIIILEYDNQGIAFPYNQVLKEIKYGYDFLLLMDQDSEFLNNDILRYKNLIFNISWDNVLAIGCSLVEQNKDFDNQNIEIKIMKADRLINSGTIVNVKLADEIGGWNEELFIDEVDFDFCYRGILKNYKLLQCNEAICLKHCIGEPLKKKYLFKWHTSMNHSFIRKYYIIRNRLYVWKKYHTIDEKWFYNNYLRENYILIKKIILMEDDKLRKLKYCFRGIKYFCQGKMGKLQD